MDCSLPGFSVHGILQARTLEWVAISFSTVAYYSGIKKDEIMPFAATWLDLEIIIPSEVNQTEKDKCHMISLTCEI